MRVGIFDSGLGGLTVLKALRNVVPSAEYIYLGDTARTPYGTKSQATIIRYARECAGFLLKQDIDVLVVACNTASAMALEVLERECPCPVIGTIEPAVKTCLEKARGEVIGVIGTNATVASAVYEKRLKELRPGVSVVSRACPLFVPIVEEGLFSGDIARMIVDHYLLDLKSTPVDTLILACTHYPLLSAVISEYLGPAVQIVDCAGSIAHQVRELQLSARPGSGAGSGSRYYVTDEPVRFNSLKNLLLEGCRVEAVHLESLAG